MLSIILKDTCQSFFLFDEWILEKKLCESIDLSELDCAFLCGSCSQHEHCFPTTDELVEDL